MFSDHSDNGCDVDEDSDHEPQNYDESHLILGGNGQMHFIFSTL